MSDDDIEPKVKRGFAWTGAAGALVSALDVLGTVIVLAIWLSPTEYGVAALALSVLPFVDMWVDFGLSAAVIHHDDHDDEKLSTVVWVQAAIGVVTCAAFVFLVGPGLSQLHGVAELAPMIAVYGALLPWKAVYLVPRALMLRELRFREVAMVRTVANIAEFAAKVGFAAAGFGVWCFVLAPVCRELAWGVGVQWLRPMRPRFFLKMRATRAWLRYGVERSTSLGLFHLYSNVDYHVVGYLFGPAATGMYRLAYELVLEPCRVVAAVTSQVAFPAFARLKDDPRRLVEQFVMVTKLNAFIVVGLLSVVAVGAEPLIETFWGPEWLGAAALARILVAVAILRAFGYVMPSLLNAVGRPDLTLRYSALATVILPALFVAAGHLGHDLGPASVAYAWVVGYPIAFFVLVRYVLEVLGMHLRTYVSAIRNVLAGGALAGLVGSVTAVGVFELPRPLALILVSAACLGSFVTIVSRWENTSPAALLRSLRSGSS